MGGDRCSIEQTARRPDVLQSSQELQIGASNGGSCVCWFYRSIRCSNPILARRRGYVGPIDAYHGEPFCSSFSNSSLRPQVARTSTREPLR
jgi:hypothetical protein